MNTLPKYFRKNTSVKTVHVNGKEWFDRINGNSYNSVQVVVNQGLKNEFYFNIPFQYGYGDYYLQSAFEYLVKMGAVDNRWRYEYVNENKIFAHIETGCLKRTVKAWGIDNA